MKLLEFENTQGINLQYSVASILDRGFAYFIDAVIITITLTILSLAFSGMFSSKDMLTLVVLAPVFIFYSLLFELLNNGKSPGKQMVGIKVIRIDGKPVRGYDYLMRWMFRWLDIYMTLGSFAAVMVGATPRGQRLGDVLADTSVIRVRRLRIPLKKVLDLGKLSKHMPQYPGVTRLSEEQAVLVKETLDRVIRFDNQQHREVQEELARRLALMLQVESYDNSRQFLQTVLKDYIALTR